MDFSMASVKNAKLINRRNFLKLGGGAVALTAIPLKLVAADEVSTDEPLAQAMGYSADATKVDTAKFPKRAGEAGEEEPLPETTPEPEVVAGDPEG